MSYDLGDWPVASRLENRLRRFSCEEVLRYEL